MLPHMAKGTAGVIKDLEMGRYPGLSRWPNVIIRVLKIRRQEGQSQIFEDAMLLALKMERIMNQGMQAASRKRQENRFFSRASRMNTLTLGLVTSRNIR